MEAYNVAILGATGAVGAEFFSELKRRKFPIKEIRALASARSAGKVIGTPLGEVKVEEATPDSFRGVDIVFASAGASVARQLAPHAVAAGAVVIDNSSAFRLDAGVPLVVPEVNPEDVRTHHGIISNPNCSTIIMVVVLKPIYDRAGIKRVVISTYQAVSGIGGKGITGLEEEVRAWAEGREVMPSTAPSPTAAKHWQIAFNLVPHIDVFQDGGYTKEEWKMVYETRKIMHDDTMAITATTVRVPVFRCHSESINIETREKLTADEARKILAGSPGIAVMDNPAELEYPMPYYVQGDDRVFVGRIREDFSIDKGLNLWVVGDQLKKGAAQNAVQIAELLVAEGLV